MISCVFCQQFATSVSLRPLLAADSADQQERGSRQLLEARKLAQGRLDDLLVGPRRACDDEARGLGGQPGVHQLAREIVLVAAGHVDGCRAAELGDGLPVRGRIAFAPLRRQKHQRGAQSAIGQRDAGRRRRPARGRDAGNDRKRKAGSAQRTPSLRWRGRKWRRRPLSIGRPSDPRPRTRTAAD